MRNRKPKNNKRERDSVQEIKTVARKTQRTQSQLPRLPDYLVKHQDATALRELIASTNQPEVVKEMQRITDDCYRQQFNLEYLFDWLSIYQFLRNPELVTPYLDQLEDALQQSVVGARAKFKATADGRKSLPEMKSNPYERREILSKYLYAWAKENGFQQQAKFISLLRSSEFLSLLRAKTFFKDSSVAANIHHGAWSHAVQWYCIIEHQKRTQFLHHQPLQVFQSFGDAKQLKTARSQKLAWDIIVDNAGDVFFAGPISLTAYMKSDESLARWPLLAGTIIRQEMKADFKYGDYKGYTEYLAEKHHPESVIIIKKL